MQPTRFGLQRRPFPATPDSAVYYPATHHEQVLAQLLRVIQDDEGLALVVGAPGTGKTLLCHCLLERLGDNVTSAFLANSHCPDRTALLQAILYDLALPHEAAGEQILRLRLTDFLLHNCAKGRRTVLVIDEAQHLSVDLLEELRMLGNLEAGAGKAIQVILAAQPEMLEALARSELAAFNQRLALRALVEPLEAEEAIDYLVHHVRLAGGRPEKLFFDNALAILARGTSGVPRLLNQATSQALLLAEQADMEGVDEEAVLEALAQLGIPCREETTDEPGLPETVTPLDLGEIPGPEIRIGA